MESQLAVRLPGDFKALRLDVVDATTTYVGKAAAGASGAAAVWQIFRLTNGAGGDLTIEWADGNAEYDNVWDNRAGGTYL